MQRRHFITTAAATLPLALSATALSGTPANGERQLIELRTYALQFGGADKNKLIDYLRGPLRAALKELGCATFHLMKPLSDEQPAEVWVLIAYPDAATYVSAQRLEEDQAFLQARKDYDAVDQPIYSRFSSQLLEAFSGMPTVAELSNDTQLFELRTYEGYNEDAVRRKTSMFNDEEMDLFDEVGLHRVFFGRMIAGPYRPALVYLLGFRDMEERNENWSKFGGHPKWLTMRANPAYANSVSNIRRTFLVSI